MASLNRVFLMGNLTRDPELRYVPSGTAVATFGLAMNRVYNTQSGEKKEEVCFMQIVTWGKRAELCGQYLSKGSLAFVEGRLQSRNWEDSSGQKRTTIEVIANSVQFLGRLKGQAKPQHDAAGEEPAVDAVPAPDLDARAAPAAPSEQTEDAPF